MATIKSYTDLEQSKKLAEILPHESADMEFMFLKKDNSMVGMVPFVKDGYEEPDCGYNIVPCWSLAALLNVLPDNEHVSTTTSRGSWKIDPVKYLPNIWWCEYEDTKNQTEFNISADNQVDACYEMIIKLNELKRL